MDPLALMFVLVMAASIFWLGFVAGSVSQRFINRKSERPIGKGKRPRFRVVEVMGAFYVERYHKVMKRWDRFAPTHDDRFVAVEPFWEKRYPFASFGTAEDANAAMIAESAREQAEVPTVKSELSDARIREA